MGRMFDLDSPLMQFLNKMADLMILNLLTLILCIPVVTAGAAISAMHYVLLKIARKDEGYRVKPFFKAFKDNFKQATLLWLLWLLIFGVLAADFVALYYNPDILPLPLKIIIIVIAIIAWLVFQLVFPLQSHFENTIKGTMRNSLLLAIGQFPKVLAMAVLNLLPLAVVMLIPQAMPVVFMFGLTLPGLACAYLYSGIFKQFEPEEEPEPDPDRFYVPESDEEMDAMGIPRSIREGIGEPAKEEPKPEETAAEETAGTDEN